MFYIQKFIHSTIVKRFTPQVYQRQHTLHGRGAATIIMVFLTVMNYNTVIAQIDISLLNGDNGFKLAEQGEVRLLAPVGDLNNDGFDDIVLPTKSNSYLIFGREAVESASQTIATLGNSILITETNDENYNTYTPAGDINNDGIEDMIVISPTKNRIVVIYGRNHDGFPSSLNLDTLTPEMGFIITGLSGLMNAEVGINANSAGDFNGDGIGDIVIGLPGASTRKYDKCIEDDCFSNYSQEGMIFLVFGRKETRSEPIDILNSPANEVLQITSKAKYGRFGHAARGVGDVNGDGMGDIAVSQTEDGYYGSEWYTGKAYVIFGSQAGLKTPVEISKIKTKITLTGAKASNFGWSLDAGDVNGDGFSDVLFGAPSNSKTSSGSSNYEGSLLTMFGKGPGNQFPKKIKAAKPTGTLLTPKGKKSAQTIVYWGSGINHFAGSQVAIGDFNNDGFDDQLISDHGFRNLSIAFVPGTDKGLPPVMDLPGEGFNIIASQAPPVPVTIMRILTPINTRDFNGDGIDDFAIGLQTIDLNRKDFKIEQYLIYGNKNLGNKTP